MARKYTPGRQKVGFSPVGQGLQSSRYEIEADAKRRQQAIKLAKEQQSYADNQMISGLADKGKFEERVLSESQTLENAARKTSYDSLSIKADRHVGRLKGEAKLLEKEADRLEKLAPKRTAAIKKLVGGLYQFSEYLEFKGMNNAYEKAGMFDLSDAEGIKVRRSLYENWLKEQKKIDSPELWDQFLRSFQGKDNTLFANKAKKNILENKTFHADNVRDFVTKQLKQPWTKTTVVEHYEDAAYMHLDHLGIDARSKGGREIIALYKSFGTLEKGRLRNVDRAANTITNIELNVDAIRNEEDPLLVQGHLETMVETVLQGTFKDGNGNFFTVDNQAEAVQIGLIQYVETNFTDFKTEADLRTFLSKFVELGTTKATLPKAKPLTEKLSKLRVDSIIQAWAQKSNKQKDIIRAEKSAQDLSFIEGYEQRRLVLEKQDKENPGSVDWAAFDIQEADRVNNQVGGTDDSKNKILSRIGISKVAAESNEMGTWVRIKQLIYDDEFADAAALYARLSESQQNILAPEFKILNLVNKANFRHGLKRGYKALFAKAKGIHLSGEVRGWGGKSLSTSGEASYGIMVDRVVLQAIGILEDSKGNLTEKEALDKAWEIEEDLFNKGYDPKKPKEFGEGPYARRIGLFDNANNKKEKRFVYREVDNDYGDEDNIHALNEELNLNGDFSKAQKELRNMDLQVLSADTVRIYASSGIRTYEDFIADHRIVSPKVKNQLIEVAKNLAKGEGYIFGDDVSAQIPENVRILAELTHRSEVEVLNDMIKGWLPEEFKSITFLADGQSAAIQRSDGEWIPKQNTYGRTLWDASMAQFQLPKDTEVSFYIDQKLDIEDSFLSKFEISKDEFGTYSDTNVFINNGGVSLLDFAAADKMFGLTNITRWKDINNTKNPNQLYSENPYTTDNPTKIKRKVRRSNKFQLPTINLK